MTQGMFVTVPGIAAICYDALRRHARTGGDSSQPEWEHAPTWLRMGYVNSIVNIAAGTARAPREVHQSWLVEKQRDGWQAGPVPDDAKKQHPALIPFDTLPAEQRVRIYLFFSIASTLIGLREGGADAALGEAAWYQLLLRRIREDEVDEGPVSLPEARRLTSASPDRRAGDDDRISESRAGMVETSGDVERSSDLVIEDVPISLFGDGDTWHGSFICSPAEWDGGVGGEIRVRLRDGRQGTAWVSHLTVEGWQDTVCVDFVGKSRLARVTEPPMRS